MSIFSPIEDFNMVNDLIISIRNLKLMMKLRMETGITMVRRIFIISYILNIFCEEFKIFQMALADRRFPFFIDVKNVLELNFQ